MSKLYRDIDRKVGRFSLKTGLRCPSGCGECCEKACVAASVIEMQPAAAHLYSTEQLEHWALRIDPQDEQARCVFYSPSGLAGGGHCRIYPFRPLVCRLFGFSVRANKHRQDELMICRVVKEKSPRDAETAETMVRNGLKAPRSMDYFLRSYTASPMLVNESMNINIAFLKAAEMIKFNLRISGIVERKEVKGYGEQELSVKKEISETSGENAGGSATGSRCTSN